MGKSKLDKEYYNEILNRNGYYKLVQDSKEEAIKLGKSSTVIKFPKRFNEDVFGCFVNFLVNSGYHLIRKDSFRFISLTLYW